MKQKAADEFMGGQSRLFDGVAVGIVLITESDPVIVDGTDAMVADGHPVGVATNIFYHLPGIGKGGFGENDPLIGTESLNPFLKSLRGSVLAQFPGKRHLFLVIGLF